MLARATLLGAAAWLLCCLHAEAREEWVVLKDCRLLRHESTDADSFHVKAAGKEYIFRLYFVDAPETDMSFEDRVAEQGQYFGLTPAQTITLGEYAKRFTREKLAHPFTVRTRLQDALGRSKMNRYYAFVETREGDLAELLVANGLARVHGTEAKPEGLPSAEREWAKLKRLERAAKHAKVGAWGAPTGRMTARAAKTQVTSGPDAFNAFFHPEKVAAASTTPQPTAAPAPQPLTSAVQPITAAAARPAASGPAPAPAAPAAGDGKLDVNTASPAELVAVPGIGPVLAQRIVEGRPYKTADDLNHVKGVGPKTYERIRQHFR